MWTLRSAACDLERCGRMATCTADRGEGASTRPSRMEPRRWRGRGKSTPAGEEHTSWKGRSRTLSLAGIAIEMDVMRHLGIVVGRKVSSSGDRNARSCDGLLSGMPRIEAQDRRLHSWDVRMDRSILLLHTIDCSCVFFHFHPCSATECPVETFHFSLHPHT